MPVTLQENLRGLLYTPYHAALSLDAYRREGVTVSLVTAPSPAEAVTGLFNGAVDVAWGGPMRSCRPMTSGQTATSFALARR